MLALACILSKGNKDLEKTCRLRKKKVTFDAPC